MQRDTILTKNRQILTKTKMKKAKMKQNFRKRIQEILEMKTADIKIKNKRN